MATDILVPLGVFLMSFGIVYVIVTARHREKMALMSLIEKGADPKLLDSMKISSKGGILKWGLLLVGVGIGILLASLLAEAGMNEPASYFSMICLFGGAGLLLANRIGLKDENRKEEK
jgi:hypothetical protein